MGTTARKISGLFWRVVAGEQGVGVGRAVAPAVGEVVTVAGYCEVVTLRELRASQQAREERSSTHT